MSKALSIKDELLRKSIHICSSVFAYALFYIDQNTLCWIVGSGALIFILFDFIRVRSFKINNMFQSVFGRVTRDFENSRLTGASYVMFASFLVLLLFDKYVCVVSILIMSYSDTAAAIVGKKYGKTKIFNKTLEGSFAFLITGLIIILILYPEINLTFSLIALILGTFVEVLPINLDDNFSVPIIVASIISLG